MPDFLHSSMISGTATAILVLTLFFLTYGTELQDEALAWITMVISIEAGVIITLIVDQKTKEAHKEVMKSHDQIQELLGTLAETDKKHNQALDALNISRELNEKLAAKSLITTLNYVVDMLNKLFNVIDLNKLGPEDGKLITNLLQHIESPLNLIMQSVQQTGSKLSGQKNDIIANTETLRKLVIASAVVGNSETKRTADALKISKEKFEDIIRIIGNSN